MDKEKRGHVKDIVRRCASFNLRRASRLITRKFDEALRDFGVKATQLSVLMAIYSEPNQPLSKLAWTLGMDRTSLTRNLKILHDRGLVLIEESGDKREHRIGISLEGERLLKDAFPVWRKVQGDVEEALGGEHWRNLLSGLHEVAHFFCSKRCVRTHGSENGESHGR
ncbi:MarR family winged helix-turn-helix transcriptional regulator [Desulfomonile tiedjei]|uniref:Transcriptional regulator n=1 Tax=Desulfomonile tiedjei (strain ATCC 49306 / DSM 6799 / DCB-1) TaxID=706587 RepID=I4CEJ5_DESTA|nr:MarR family winged helix-turn-helix transcriptional regulator [Desulfomonile tiedjei]AFM27986.1 transcriptional regulator [Desulfomonile tiedjei DSM 6799]